MPHLWAPQGIYKKVRSLPYLLSSIRIPGQAARSCKIELVANNRPLAIGFDSTELVAGLLLAEPETSSKEHMSNDQQQATSDQKPDASNNEPEASCKVPQIIGENNGGK